MKKEHQYFLQLEWTGNKGSGTSSYTAYERDHIIKIENKADLSGSSDAAFRGNKTRHNPEELLVASIAACHMLWYLHLCSEAKIVVTSYVDKAVGVMQETENGSGYFKEVILYPDVVVKDASMIDEANALHKKANEFCFIANSVKFPVHHQPTCTAE